MKLDQARLARHSNWVVRRRPRLQRALSRLHARLYQRTGGRFLPRWFAGVMSNGYRQAVATKPARRTQAERREATTGALVEAARELFAQDGYAATSIDAVAAKARVTKGAFYHHFDGKPQLFEAVFACEVARLTTALAAVYVRKKDPWAAFEAGCRAFLEECLEPGLQRILLLDGTAAIGWEAMRRLEAPLFEMMEIGITRAVEAGRIAPRPAGPLSHFLFGALCETAMVVARVEDQKAAHRKAVTELCRVMDGLAFGAAAR